MAGFPVLSTLQPIVGADMHKSIPPIVPVFVPHVVVWGVGLSQKSQFMWAVSTSKASTRESGCTTPVVVGCGHGCGRTHDAGPHPVHIWPNFLLPVIMLGSASKAEFGSGSVKIATSQGKADTAINVAYVLNLNLHCQDFPLPPLPTGLAITVNYTVKADFTFADLCRGLVQMIVDMALTWVVGLACAALSSLIKGLSAAAGSRAAAFAAAFKDSFTLNTAQSLFAKGTGFFAANGRLFVQNMSVVLKSGVSDWTTARAPEIGSAIVSTFGFGTPTGYSPGYTPVGGHAGSATSGWIDGLFR